MRMWQELFDLLGDLSFFDAAWTANEVEVRTAWSLVKSAGRLEPIAAYRSVLAKPGMHDVNAVWRLGMYLQASGYGTELLPLWSDLIESFRAAKDDACLQGCLGNQALILGSTGDLDGAMRLHKEEEAIAQEAQSRNTVKEKCFKSWGESMVAPRSDASSPSGRLLPCRPLRGDGGAWRRQRRGPFRVCRIALAWYSSSSQSVRGGVYVLLHVLRHDIPVARAGDADRFDTQRHARLAAAIPAVSSCPFRRRRRHTRPSAIP